MAAGSAYRDDGLDALSKVLALTGTRRQVLHAALRNGGVLFAIGGFLRLRAQPSTADTCDPTAIKECLEVADDDNGHGFFSCAFTTGKSKSELISNLLGCAFNKEHDWDKARKDCKYRDRMNPKNNDKFKCYKGNDCSEEYAICCPENTDACGSVCCSPGERCSDGLCCPSGFDGVLCNDGATKMCVRVGRDGSIPKCCKYETGFYFCNVLGQDCCSTGPNTGHCTDGSFRVCA